MVQGTAWLFPKELTEVRVLLSPRMTRVLLVVGGGLQSRQSPVRFRGASRVFRLLCLPGAQTRVASWLQTRAWRFDSVTWVVPVQCPCCASMTQPRL